MGNRKLVASVASACTLGLLAGVGAVALIGTAGAASPKATYNFSLSGAQQVPVGPAGTAQASVKVKGKQLTVCVKLKYVSASILPATLAHIHKAPAGMNGPIVVNLNAPTAKKVGKVGKSKTCATGSTSLINALIATPNQYYVNIHNAAFPNGAIRGQLAP